MFQRSPTIDFNCSRERRHLDAIDNAELAQWLDDRILDFVHTYLALHENEYYLKEKMVEDPIAKVRFPSFAAAATLEHKGKTLCFIDESTLREFQHRAVDGQS